MQCEDIREQFAEYVSANIESSIRLQIAEHLNACQPCRLELDELKSLWVKLGDIPPAEPTADIRTRFNELLDQHQSLRLRATALALRARRVSQRLSRHPSSAEEGSLQLWRRRMFQVGVAAASLVLGIAIGYYIRPATGGNTELAELRSELYQTRQMVALSLMQQQAATDRLKGISWSYQLQQPSTELLRALLDTLMHDPSVNVRLATVDALRQFGNQPVVRRGVVEAMARQQSPMVEISLIDLAVDLREKESIAALRQLTEDQTLDQAVRERAQRGLMELE
jgi:hypothetical protein